MATIELVETGVVYRNSKPHLRSRHAYFPSVARPGGSGGDDLVVTMDIGSAFEAVDMRSYACRSIDGGRTWSEPALMFDPPPGYSTTCRVSSVGEGNLAGLASLMDRSRPEEGLGNPLTDGFVRTEWALVRSRDGGRTWSPPQAFAAPIDWNGFEACSAIVALPSGRWLAPTATWPDWEGRSPFGCKALVMISDDRGATWTKATNVMDQWSDRVAHYEQKQVLLSDGRLLAVCWVVDHKTKQNLPNGYAFSRDDGDSYTAPRPTPLLGETCTPVALAGNRVLCVYRRTDRKGLWAHLALIEGEDWRPLADAPLWGTNVAAHSTAEASLLAQMSTLRFGYPSVVKLVNDEVFAVFWCVEDCVSNIRWLRLRVS
jgi:sialidase-1